MKFRHPKYDDKERNRKISLSKMGDKNPMKREKVRLKSSLSHMGKISGMLGKKHTKKTKEKLLNYFKGHWTGNKNPRWKDGLSWLEKLEKKAGRKRSDSCEICGSMERICFDHDHKTGKFRGWICDRCNVVLGRVKDSKDLLIKLKEYLENEITPS